MECQRCLLGLEAKYRVYTDIVDMKVCAACADEARRLGIVVEVLDGGKGKNNGAQKQTQTPELPAGILGFFALVTDDLRSVSRDNLPTKMIVFNNSALEMVERCLVSVLRGEAPLSSLRFCPCIHDEVPKIAEIS
jgi:hypothetical protein